MPKNVQKVVSAVSQLEIKHHDVQTKEKLLPAGNNQEELRGAYSM